MICPKCGHDLDGNGRETNASGSLSPPALNYGHRADPGSLRAAGALIGAISRYYGVLTASVLSKMRGTERISRARHAAMWLIRRQFGWSYPEIGKLFGRDHSSVMHGVQTFTNLDVTGALREQLIALAMKSVQEAQGAVTNG